MLKFEKLLIKIATGGIRKISQALLEGVYMVQFRANN